MSFPSPINEPVRSFAPGFPERQSLQASLAEMSSRQIEIPLVIGGKEIRTGQTAASVMPHRHRPVLSNWHKAQKEDVNNAVAAAAKARKDWASTKFEDRALIFLRAAELLSTTWRDTLSAATMLNQSKTAHQSEID